MKNKNKRPLKDKKKAKLSEKQHDVGLVKYFWKKYIYTTSDIDPFPTMHLFRICFYTLMAWEWIEIIHGPYGQWQQAFFYYDFRSLAGEIAPRTIFGSRFLIISGVVAALCSVRYRFAAIIFSCLFAHNLFTSVTNFNNHDYLFVLISILLAGYANTRSNKTKLLYIKALQSQIVVVYFYASLWKITPDWLDGTICKNIFLSFEQQGVARGIPWQSIYSSFPNIFQIIAFFGVFLDSLLFLSLAFFPLGSKMQLAALIFHGFTSITMSQRIGYTFPFVMIASGLLFQKMSEQSSSSYFKTVINFLKYKPVPYFLFLWIALQWLLPARMPFVSKGEFKYTSEGYRHSWTMMLHSKNYYITPGLFFADLSPSCKGDPLPNPMKEPFLNPKSFPYLKLIGERGWAGLSTYTRQFPSVAAAIRTALEPMCPRNDLKVHASVFAQANDGPFVRLFDPTVDLTQTYDALKNRSIFQSLSQSFLDKVPQKNEFILRNLGSLEVKKEKDLHHFIDRSGCLIKDPLRFFSVSVELSVLKTPVPLFAKICSTLNEDSCYLRSLDENPIQIEKSRMISVITKSVPQTKDCKDSKEDILISLRHLK